MRIRTSRDVVFNENVFYVQQAPISFRQLGYELDDHRADRDVDILSPTNPTDENCAAEAPASLGGEGGDGPATAGPSNERATVSCQAPSVSIIPCATNSDSSNIRLPSTRLKKRPERLIEEAYVSIEPQTLREALSSPESEEWRAAMEEELQSLLANNTWTLVPLPPGRRAVKSKWVYKAKLDSEGNLKRHKARLVAKGFSQKKGVDYTETYAPVVRHESLRTVLAIAAVEDLEIMQVDVKTAF